LSSLSEEIHKKRERK